MEQLVNLETRGYTPLPKQCLFHAAARAADRPGGPTKIGFGGARGPGKTTTIFAQVTLDDCQRVPGLKWLFLRQTQKTAKESFDDLRLNLLRNTSHIYNKSGLLTFPNTSRVLIGGYKNDSDIDKYLGIEYDGIVIEEDGQISANKKKQLLTSMRTSKVGWRPRSYHSTNPGGLDHAGFKRTFVDPYRKGVEKDTRFIPSTATDNPFLNPEYVDTLKALTGWLRKAWLDGDWDIAAGQYFTNYNQDRIVLKTLPFDKIPDNWPVWASLDYGYTHPTAVYLLTKHDGIIYVVAEHFKAKKLPHSHAESIIHLFRRWGVELSRLRTFLAGQDVFQMKGDSTGKTIADQYRAAGIRLRPAVTDRVAGATRILELLGDEEAGIAPKLQIFPNCLNLIEQLPAMVHDPNHPEDVLKVDADEDGLNGDDAYDSFRYGVSSEGGVGIY